MKKSLLFLLLIVGLILVPQALANDEDAEFGAEVAGTWLGTGWFAFDGNCDGYPDNPDPDSWTYFDFDSQSFGAGGLYVSTNPSNPNTGQGTWKKTGDRELTTNNITYLNLPWPVDLDNGTTAPGGLTWIARIPGVYTFDRKFQTGTSSFGAIAYFPTQDPLDKNETPVFCTAGQHTSLRKVDVD